jgi:hypothetical protein
VKIVFFAKGVNVESACFSHVVVLMADRAFFFSFIKMLRSTKFFRTCRSLHIGSSRLQIVGNNKGSNFRVKVGLELNANFIRFKDDLSRVTYALKEDFAELKNKMREEHKGNADTGVKPSDWQKKMLVLTRLYHDRQSIPEYVA